MTSADGVGESGGNAVVAEISRIPRVKRANATASIA
jgi:hypothetical protein